MMVESDTKKVHPHACGENVWLTVGSLISRGSPPRLWGKPFERQRDPLIVRFTPTPVGKTPVARLNPSRRSVHPHACGENDPGCRTRNRTKGSPPRLWGKPESPVALRTVYRFTPTPVGKTAPENFFARLRAVHPHACGENIPLPIASSRSSGSPPRLWGKLPLGIGFCVLRRFTPTPVGKTHVHVGRAAAGRVHPHACGENILRAPIGVFRSGSPPRLWGKPWLSRVPSWQRRFTPTPVGKTLSYPAAALQAEVHPHACGENDGERHSWSRTGGSPPRLWGKRLP